jgi:hypothetical protein
LRVRILARFCPIVLLAVAVGIQYQRRPTLRSGCVAGLKILVGVQPTDNVTATTGPKRVVVVVGKL